MTSRKKEMLAARERRNRRTSEERGERDWHGERRWLKETLCSGTVGRDRALEKHAHVCIRTSRGEKAEDAGALCSTT